MSADDFFKERKSAHSYIALHCQPVLILFDPKTVTVPRHLLY